MRNLIIGIIILLSIIIQPSISYTIIYTADHQLNFSWTPASGTVDHYNVYVSTNDGPFVMVGETPINSYIVETTWGNSIVMQVEAENAAGIGPRSDISEIVMVFEKRPTTPLNIRIEYDL